MESTAEQATQAGMVVFAAAGENDSSDGGLTPANVDLPASSPHIIGCGGTTKTATTETVWNNEPGNTSGQGTGGGFSTIFPPQSFQIGAPQGTGRMVPDVAADADPFTGYLIVEAIVGQEAINRLGLMPVGCCPWKSIKWFLSQVGEQPFQPCMEPAIRQRGGGGYLRSPNGQREIGRHPSLASKDFLPGISSYGSVWWKRK